MTKILANDGIAENGKKLLEENGIEVVTEHIPQEKLSEELKNFDGIIVRSATKVRKDLIDSVPDLKFIGRAGVGMDNIDVEYAREKGIKVANTPAASSQSVAELVFAHLSGMVRFLHASNRAMPDKGSEEFKKLKKEYSKGTELRGKTLGLVGFGRIGVETARIGIGLGMNILAYDVVKKEIEITLPLHPALTDQKVRVTISTIDKDSVISNSDFISLHTPFIPAEGPVISSHEFSLMKNGSGLVNCARGGVVDENALLAALDEGKIRYAGVDVFEEEPTNNVALLRHPHVSLTPHIGASTAEAQKRVAEEMARQVVDFFS
jgi:D-3-phosphoglycerate dehydrogenase / 2-oxoglutarate reductase